MMKRGQVRRPIQAMYLIVDAKIDAYKALWKKRVVLGWYPNKTASDTHLASFILENINLRTGEFGSVAVFNAGGHSLRSLSVIAGLPSSTVKAVLERWVDLQFINRCTIGEGRSGRLSINWHVIRFGFSAPVSIEARNISAEASSELRRQTDGGAA